MLFLLFLLSLFLVSLSCRSPLPISWLCSWRQDAGLGHIRPADINAKLFADGIARGDCAMEQRRVLTCGFTCFLACLAGRTAVGHRRSVGMPIVVVIFPGALCAGAAGRCQVPAQPALCAMHWDTCAQPHQTLPPDFRRKGVSRISRHALLGSHVALAPNIYMVTCAAPDLRCDLRLLCRTQKPHWLTVL